MYLMYVDESGDSGKWHKNSPTRYFILSAIVIHEADWKDTLTNLVNFRRTLRDTKGLKLREEIHCTEFINKPGALIRIKRNDRLDILKKCLDWLNNQKPVSVFSVAIDKQGRTDDIFETAWSTLIMRFENTIKNNNFKRSKSSGNVDKGVIVSDHTDGKKLRGIIRKMRHFNYVPSQQTYGSGARNIKLEYIIEDPVFRHSKDSLLHQICDVVAYFVRQKVEPNSYVKKKGGHNYYGRLTNVILKPASSKNNEGIVYL